MQNQLQITAADPSHSVWVSASAGTGKTKILTDRVLRLLLQGVEFDKILCLTFTNAASNEMLARVTNALLAWQSNPEKIENLLSRKAKPEEILSAKKLFNKLILSPNQLSIHTIHSFCQKILQKFPFEAGVDPGFKVLSDTETKELCDKVISEISDELQLDNKINESFFYILKNIHELTFASLVMEILADQIDFRDLFSKYESSKDYEDFLKKETQVIETDSFYLEEFAKLDLKDITIGNTQWKENEIELIEAYNNYVKLSAKDKIKHFPKFKLLFCTLKDEPRKTLLYKKSATENPEIYDILRNIQQKIIICNDKIKISRMIESTIHMYDIAKYIIDKYTNYKRNLVSLDYDDLIYYAKELLSNNHMKDWVLYKLDGGIKHLLVDEAQDTSPKQWQIIEAIMREFYSGDTASKEERTIFIVGDEKQSIYSFQGADVSNFSNVSRYIQDQMHKAQKQYKNIELESSYRSSSSILDVVAKVFEEQYNSLSKLQCHRKGDNGLVELWPLYGKDEEDSQNRLFWPLVDEMESVDHPYKKLAKDIAHYIKNYLASGIILPSTKEKVKPGDFMILIRRRNQLTHEIIAALKELQVPVSGIDRMLIMNHLSVQDIISIAKFTLLPYDDLNLASLLKSPIIGLDEKGLYNIAYNRKSSLYDSIKDKKILDWLNHFCDAALNMNLFAFLHYIIDILDIRSILRAANGENSDDVLDELLNLASEFKRSHNHNLQEFVIWLEMREIEIKRNTISDDNVKIMTIHASKGLESPIVMLVDTTSLPTSQNHFLWQDDLLLWPGTSKNSNSFYQKYNALSLEKNYQEYMRLLYVAMTRAEDHLIIAGIKPKGEASEKSWYSIIAESLDKMPISKENDIIYYGNHHIIDKKESGFKAKIIEASFHSCLNQNIPQIHKEEWKPKYSASPLISRMNITYGIILHKILEDSVKTKNFTFDPMHPLITCLNKATRDHITNKMPALFAMPEFVSLMHYPEVFTEMPIGYRQDNIVYFSRIDLVAISEQELVIIDYKSEKNPPQLLKDVNPKYIMQIESYAKAMRKIKPYHKISAKILWLENLHMMEILKC